MDAVLSPDTSVGTKVAVKVSCCCALARQRTFGPVQHRAGLQVPKLEVFKSSSHCCLQEALQQRYQTLRRSVDPTDEELVFFIENTDFDDSAGNCSYTLRAYLLLGDKGRKSGTTFLYFPWLTAPCLMTQWKACCRKADPGVQRPAAGVQCLWRSMKGTRFKLLLIAYRRLFSKDCPSLRGTSLRQLSINIGELTTMQYVPRC